MKAATALALAALTWTACASPEKNMTDDVTTEAGGAHATHGGHADHAEHGAHEHRFVDPSKYAERWNDPARDEWQKPAELVGLMGIEPGMTVADLGAGTGYMLPHLSAAVGPEGEVLALDVEDAMIAYIEENLAAYGPNVRAVKVPSDSPGVEPGSLDRLVTINTWHHVAGREAYAAKVLEALKPGGRFVVVEFTLDSPIGAPKEMRVDSASVAADLKAGGFDASVAEETMPNHHVVIGVKR